MAVTLVSASLAGATTITLNGNTSGGLKEPKSGLEFSSVPFNGTFTNQSTNFLIGTFSFADGWPSERSSQTSQDFQFVVNFSLSGFPGGAASSFSALLSGVVTLGERGSFQFNFDNPAQIFSFGGGESFGTIDFNPSGGGDPSSGNLFGRVVMHNAPIAVPESGGTFVLMTVGCAGLFVLGSKFHV